MISGAIPEDVMSALMKADPAPEIQTQKLSWAVIRGIESTGKVIDLISTVPIKDYPKSSWLWSGYRKWDRGNGSDNRLVPFINLLGLKQLTRFIGCAGMLLRWAIANRGGKRHILQFGLTSAHLYAVRLVKLLFPIKNTVLITDLPVLKADRESWWRRALRPIDYSMVHRAVLASDGVIALTRQVTEDYAPSIPAIVMEGVVSIESEESAKMTPEPDGRPTEFVVLYTGGLSQSNGVLLLLDAFAKLPSEDARLWVFGGGDMAEDVRRRAERDRRIYFPGFVSPVETIRRAQEATVLVNPRLSRQSFTPYSFPSKLIEYMAAGRPVVSTRLPGIPAEYDPYIVWLDRETPEGLATLLRSLQEQPRIELDRIGLRGRDFVLHHKNYREQGKRIVEFMDSDNLMGKK